MGTIMDHSAAPNDDGTDFSDTWLIVPCYNEATVIRGVLENALQTLSLIHI